MNIFETFGKILRGLFVALVIVTALFAVFPLILLGVDGINATHNVSEYFGLVDLNNLAPLLVYLSILGLVAAPFAWIFRKRIKKLLPTQLGGGDNGMTGGGYGHRS